MTNVEADLSADQTLHMGLLFSFVWRSKYAKIFRVNNTNNMLMVLTLNMAGAQTTICFHKQLEIHKNKTRITMGVAYERVFIGSISVMTNVICSWCLHGLNVSCVSCVLVSLNWWEIVESRIPELSQLLANNSSMFLLTLLIINLVTFAVWRPNNAGNIWQGGQITAKKRGKSVARNVS